MSSNQPGLKRLALSILIFGIAFSLCGCSGRAYAPAPLVDLGDAPRTQMVAALDEPMESGKNVVWTASFVAAWKRLQDDLAGGTVQLDGAQQLVASLNAAPDPVKDVPPEMLYAVAGFEANGISQQIREEVARRFPGSPPPNLPMMGPLDAIAYARLVVKAKFPVPYFDAQKPLQWKDGAGNAHDLRGFGIFMDSPDRVLSQPRLLFDIVAKGDRPRQFALDLNDPSEPIEIMVASVAKCSTLAETLAAVNAARSAAKPEPLDFQAHLLVPEMAWRLSHSFEELKNRKFTAGALKGGKITEARQDVDFRLDRSGVELRAESNIMLTLGHTPEYVFDGPFLLMLRYRTSDKPFFVLWVENDELLRPFTTPAEGAR